MADKSLWQQLKDLVDCDKQIASYTEEIDHLKDAIVKEQTQLGQQDTIIQAKQKAVFTLQKEANLKELQLKELKEIEARKRKHLDSANDQKTYKALEREVSHAAQQRSRLEEEVTRQLIELDDLKQAHTSLLENKDGIVAKIKHDIQIKEENLAHAQEKLSQTYQRRADAFAILKPEWQAQYERMKQRVPDPVIPVLNGSCSSCFYVILFHDLAMLKKGSVLVCRNCYRFLYHDEEATKTANQERF